MADPFECLPDSLVLDILISLKDEYRAGFCDGLVRSGMLTVTRMGMLDITMVCKRFSKLLEVTRFLDWDLSGNSKAALADFLLTRPLVELGALSLIFGSNMPFESNATLVVLLMSQHIKTLCLDDVYFASRGDGLLFRTLQASPNLEYLRLSSSSLTALFKGVSFSQLRVLHLNCKRLATEGLAQGLPVLEELKFVGMLNGLALRLPSLLRFSWRMNDNSHLASSRHFDVLVDAPELREMNVQAYWECNTTSRLRVQCPKLRQLRISHAVYNPVKQSRLEFAVPPILQLLDVSTLEWPLAKQVVECIDRVAELRVHQSRASFTHPNVGQVVGVDTGFPLTDEGLTLWDFPSARGTSESAKST